jgi:hypothetical protein
MNRSKATTQALNLLASLYGGVLFGSDRRYRRKVNPAAIEQVERREGKLYRKQIEIAERHWKQLVESGFDAPRSWHPHCVRVYGQPTYKEVLDGDGAVDHYLLENPGLDRNAIRKIIAEIQAELDRLECAPPERPRAVIHVSKAEQNNALRSDSVNPATTANGTWWHEPTEQRPADHRHEKSDMHVDGRASQQEHATTESESK